MAKIMIVDDSRTMRKMISGALTEQGHEIVGDVGNGADAIKMLETVKPDIITLDITMPVMDGIEALGIIKEKYPEIKVVMVSAAGMKEKVMEALKKGASDFLQKPFDKDSVVNVINRLAN